MIRALIISLFFIFLLPSVLADSWDDFSDVDRMWDGQKSITNKEFEQVMDALEEKANKKEEKKKKKLFKRIGGGGTSLHKELNPESDVSEIEPIKQNEEGILLNSSVDLIVGGGVLERGYYKVLAERNKDDNKIYLSFYQSQFFKGKIEATETNEDYGEKSIDFVRLLPYTESYVKIIFGSIDFNAYAFIPYN
jgi:hypothetical protein